jgi:hypothetical protein
MSSPCRVNVGVNFPLSREGREHSARESLLPNGRWQEQSRPWMAARPAERALVPAPHTTRGALPGLLALQQVQADGFGEGFRAAVDVQFVVEAAELRLDRIGGDHQLGGHLRRGAARRKLTQKEVFALA